MRAIVGTLVVGAALFTCACGSEQPAAVADVEKGNAAFARRDFETAFNALKPAAEAGDADAEFKIGFMYINGRGVDRDFANALLWMQRAADQGHAEAQYNMALNYAGGRGVAEDAVQAFFWSSLAAQQGYRAAGELKEDVASRMTEDQLREARKRISQWRIR